jgi:hypothetical protein
MCVCTHSILMHVIPVGESRTSYCLDLKCDCREFVKEA